MADLRTGYGSVPNTAPSAMGVSDCLVIREQDRFVKGTPYQDKLFGLIFIVFLLLILILSIFFFVQNENRYEDDAFSSNDEFLNDHFWILSVSTLAISVGNTLILLFILRSYTSHLIWFTLIFSSALWIIYGVSLLFIFQSIAAGICILLIALIQLLWIYCIQSRIQFASAMISLSITALNTFRSSYTLSIFGIIAQTLWLMVWLMGFSYSIDGTNSTRTVLFLYLIAYYWTFQVISNIVLCSISGVVAVWYFLFPSHAPRRPVFKAFTRSMTTSFGSICYGSLVIAVVQLLRVMVRMFKSEFTTDHEVHAANQGSK